MKYALLTYRNYRRGAYVLESTVEYTTAPALIALLPANAEAIDAISAGVVGHHFVDTPEFSYQLVVQA